MLIDIHMKFCEDSLNGFQVIEGTWFCDCPREITKKNARIMVLALCTSSNVVYYMKFGDDSLNDFQVIQRTQFYDSPREITQEVYMQEL